MPQIDRSSGPTAGYLVEYDFIREGMRQDQRERQGFLGFSLAASGLILGLLMRSDPPRTPTEACFLVGLAAGVTLVAERLTIRASQGVASGGAYLRLFVEPHVEGLEYQRRNEAYIKRLKGAASASRGFGLAYLALTAAFVLAWIATPVDGDREWWHLVIVGLLAAVSLYQSGKLLVASLLGWRNVDRAWEAIMTAERQTAPGGTESSSDEVPRPPSRVGLLLTLLLAGLALLILGAGLLLWLPVASAAEGTPKSDLGAGLIGGAIIAFVVLIAERLFEDRARRDEQERQARAEHEERNRRELADRGDLRLLLGLNEATPGIDLSDRDLRGFYLRGKKMPEGRLVRSNLEGADLTQVVLERADLSGAQLRQANLTQAVLTSARLGGADLSQADLIGANLDGVFSATSATFREADFTGASLDKATLYEADLEAANLAGAKLRGTRLHNAKLIGASLTLDADLTDAQLPGADLTGAAIDAVLSDTDLDEGDLSGVTFRAASRLERTSMQRARLLGTDFSQVATFSGVSLTGAVYDEATRWPQWIDPAAEGAVRVDGPSVA